MNVWQKEAVAAPEVATKAPPRLGLPRLHKGASLWDGVHIAKSDADRLRIFQHRYQIYIATRGDDYPGADHRAGIIRDAADDDAILVYSTSASGEILSSLRIGLMAPSEVLAQPQIAEFIVARGDSAMRFGSVAFLARMCSISKVQKDLLRLMLFGYYIGLRNDIEYAFLSARPEFQRLYERLGYYLIGPFNLGEQSSVFSLLLFGVSMTDYARFIETGSPYAPLLDVVSPEVRVLSSFQKAMAAVPQ